MEERLDQLIVNARNLQLDKVNTKAIAAGVAAAATECEADAARQIDQYGRRHQGGEREGQGGVESVTTDRTPNGYWAMNTFFIALAKHVRYDLGSLIQLI